MKSRNVIRFYNANSLCAIVAHTNRRTKTKTERKIAQGTALKEFGKAKEAAQEAEESAGEQSIRRYVGGGRRRVASKQGLREAVGERM